MKPCWRDRGMTEAGAALADSVLADMQAIVDRVGFDVAYVAMYEAKFRKDDLPKRTDEYRRRYLKANE